jgi:uncharacterized CHY-type Zn-finger protein
MAVINVGLRQTVSEPRYLSGDAYALAEYQDEIINCDVCSKEFNRSEYHSDTCVNCEDEGK